MSTKEKLIEKIHKEQEEYLADLKKRPAEKIIAKSYETCYREELICILESSDIYDENDITVLLEMPDTLGELYGEWLSTDCSVCDMLLDTVQNCIREVKNDC